MYRPPLPPYVNGQNVFGTKSPISAMAGDDPSKASALSNYYRGLLKDRNLEPGQREQIIGMTNPEKADRGVIQDMWHQREMEEAIRQGELRKAAGGQYSPQGGGGEAPMGEVKMGPGAGGRVPRAIRGGHSRGAINTRSPEMRQNDYGSRLAPIRDQGGEARGMFLSGRPDEVIRNEDGTMSPVAVGVNLPDRPGYVHSGEMPFRDGEGEVGGGSSLWNSVRGWLNPVGNLQSAATGGNSWWDNPWDSALSAGKSLLKTAQEWAGSQYGSAQPASAPQAPATYGGGGPPAAFNAADFGLGNVKSPEEWAASIGVTSSPGLSSDVTWGAEPPRAVIKPDGTTDVVAKPAPNAPVTQNKPISDPRTGKPIVNAYTIGAPVGNDEIGPDGKVVYEGAQMWARRLFNAAKNNPGDKELAKRAAQAEQWAAMSPGHRAAALTAGEAQVRNAYALDKAAQVMAEQMTDGKVDPVKQELWKSLNEFNRTGSLPQPRVIAGPNGSLTLAPNRYGTGSSAPGVVDPKTGKLPPGLFNEAIPGGDLYKRGGLWSTIDQVRNKT